jgi:O-antigen/teichoic acid export membrane protein
MIQESDDSSLGQRVATGAAWTVSFRLADRVLGVASTLVLARLLTPADFGLVAMASVMLAFLEVLTATDFGSAIIQNPTATRDHYDTAFTLSLLFGVSATSIMALSAVPLAHFFSEPRLAPVALTLSVLPLIDGLYNMGCVDFRKHFQFRKDFVYQVGRKMIGLAVVVPLAFAFRSYWALIGGMIAGRLGGLALSYALHPFRPRLSLRSAAGLIRFSRWIMINNALTFLSTRGAHLIIGQAGGPRALGLYGIAHEMANLPTTELAMPINRAVFPGYSKLSHDLEALRQAFLRVVGLVAMVALPAGLGMAAVAHLFVPAVLGAKWLDAAPLISILAVGGAIHVLQANIESLYYSMGLPRLRATITLIEISMFLPLVALMLHWHGLRGAALASLVTTCMIVPCNFALALRLVRLNYEKLLAVLWRPALAALLMAAVVLWAFPVSSAHADSAVSALALLGAASLGAGAYAATLICLWLVVGRPDGAEQWLLVRSRAAIERARQSRIASSH